ncbi:MAG: diguanylate cyclase [Firmicutes bacterium]|jgi:diguanylate cyclase (GGDEF)-like protein/PAS domain S-box-containing protein|nr:diguanylate cyclase [Bacillota bacterium]
MLALLAAIFVCQSHLVHHRILKPLNTIKQKATEIASDSSHLGESISIPSALEFCELANAFNTMSARLEASRDEMRGTIDAQIQELRHMNVQLETELSERLRIQGELAAGEERFRAIFECAEDLIYIKDRSGRYLHVNPAMTKMFGMPEASFLGRTEDELLGPDSSPRELSVNGSANPKFALREYSRTIKGKPRTFSLIEAPLLGANGEIIGVCGIARDITERKQAEEQIRYLSYHDKLTGLYNRAYAEEVLVQLSKEDCLPLSLVMMDVNGLKLVNETIGHHQGDRLLANVARTLTKICREQDVVARWGGDEFVLILPHTSPNVAAEMCEQIQETLARSTPGPVQLTVSFGVADLTVPDRCVNAVLAEAENRMYRHKLTHPQSVRSSLISSLRKTLEEKTHETEEHAARLEKMAVRIGRELGLSLSELNDISLLCVLHDIGKIAIPDSILNKPEPLTSAEWEIMKRHPEIGARISGCSSDLHHLSPAILAHHERWDGTGYPFGMRGESIPLISRIVAIVDAYDVMTHPRPYKAAMTEQEALAELKRCAGTQFDPSLVPVFLHVMEANRQGVTFIGGMNTV